jgi:transposase
LSSRELDRVEVMGRVRSGDLKLIDAARLLAVSYRQVKRLWRRYQRAGRQGLKHGNAGRPSNRSKPWKLRRRVLHLIRKKYSGSVEKRFGPTLAAEHLAEEDGIVVDHDTLRRWMLGEGLWSRQRQRKKHCQRRERKAHFGELVQLDGSFHGWLEDRGPRGCLMDMVDDATNQTLARMGKEETTWAAVGVLRAWIEKHGVPQSLYTDWKNVYKRKATPAEELQGKVPLSQFGRMCQKLGIGIIAASSAQAKGRVERIHGVHQDRLIKKLRRKKIASYQKANEYLENKYLPEHNRRFARQAAKPENYHRRKPSAHELHEIFRLETERRISNDWVIRHEGHYLQLQPAGQSRYGPTQTKALVCEWEDGSMEVYYRGQRLAYKELPVRLPRKSEVEASANPRVPFFGKGHKPSPDHPWRQSYDGMKTGWSKKVAIPSPPMVASTEARL